MTISRRNVLKMATQGVGVAGLAALAMPSIRPAMAAGKKVTITQAVRNLAYIQNFVAIEKDFFASEGLDATLLDTAGGGPDVQIVLAGQAEFTVNDGAQVLPALQKGKSLVCVLSLLDRSIVNATMRRETAERLGITADTPFEQKLQALKGLKIGITRPGALTWQMARYNVMSAGLDPDKDAQIVGIGGAPALGAALEKGDVDVIYISVPIGEKLVNRGEAITFINNARGEDPSLPKFMMEGLWVTPDFLQNNQETVAQAVRALRKASDFIINSSPEETAAVLAPVLQGLGEDALISGCTMAQAAVSRTGVFTQQDLDNTQNVLERNGFLSRRFTIGEVFDNRFAV